MASGRVSKVKGKVLDTPTVPTIGTATAGAESASVEFTAATKGGPAFSYTALSNPGSITGTGTSSPVTVSGLTAGTSYTFTVRGTNPTGNSEYSSASNSITALVAGGYESIATYNTPGSGTDTITFSSIPSTFKHLQLRASVRTSRTAGNDLISLRFNGDTGANYSDHLIRGSGAGSYGVDKDTSSTYINVHRASSNFNTTNVYAGYIIDILDYASTSKTKTTKAFGGYDANGNGQIAFNSGNWRNSSTAINSITIIFPNFSTYAIQNMHFALYGIKG